MHPEHCCLQWVGTRRQTAATLVGVMICASQTYGSQTCTAGCAGAAACLFTRQPECSSSGCWLAWPGQQPTCLSCYSMACSLWPARSTRFCICSAQRITYWCLAAIPLPGSPTPWCSCLCPPCPAFNASAAAVSPTLLSTSAPLLIAVQIAGCSHHSPQGQHSCQPEAVLH